MISQQLYNIGRRFPNDFPIIIHNFPDEYPNHSSHFAYWKIMGIMMNYGDYPNSSHFIYRSSPTQAHGLQPWKKTLWGPVEEFRAATGDATLVHFGTDPAGGVSQSASTRGDGPTGE